MESSITIGDFERIDVRAGVVVAARTFPEARKPAYKFDIDFGPELGVRASSAQITDLYAPEDLVGRLVAAVVNLPPRKVGSFVSEVLVLGFPDRDGRVVLATPERDVPPGARLY